MLIVVTDCYQTQSIVIESPLQEDEVDELTMNRELELLSNFLNRELTGRSLTEIAALDWTEIDREFAQYTDFLDLLLNQLKSLQVSNSSPIIIQGIAESTASTRIFSTRAGTNSFIFIRGARTIISSYFYSTRISRLS